SVVANVVPADVAGLVAAWERGEVARARELHFKLYPLARAMFVESNPAPAKAALAMLGRMSDEVRLPLAPLSADARAKVEKALRAYGLL
ncbi:MAG: dihydrodipicolinate synthase family protein, partial [Planctomycetes bacterium]|nr:dihydrodipicolinate synthase family protein [Planctomycetota bacterium]